MRGVTRDGYRSTCAVLPACHAGTSGAERPEQATLPAPPTPGSDTRHTSGEGGEGGGAIPAILASSGGVARGEKGHEAVKGHGQGAVTGEKNQNTSRSNR